MQQLSGGVRTLLATWILFFYFKQKISQRIKLFDEGKWLRVSLASYDVFAAFITVG